MAKHLPPELDRSELLNLPRGDLREMTLLLKSGRVMYGEPLAGLGMAGPPGAPPPNARLRMRENGSADPEDIRYDAIDKIYPGDQRAWF